MKHTLIIGYGPTGQAIATRLAGKRTLTVAQRHRPADLPEAIAFVACDMRDADTVLAAAHGMDEIVLTIGLPYDGALWRAEWPRIMANVLKAGEATGARMLFIDNLYMYGPQTVPLREDLPLTDGGVKPALRAAITRQWQASKARFVALRAPDFYGPGVENSHFGALSLKRIAEGRTATLVMAADAPHDIAYVPDIARAAELLLDAPADVERQAWHLPCAPALTPRAFLALAARVSGMPLKLRRLPPWTLPVLGLVSPLLRELNDMRFALDRPYHVDAGKFTSRFAFAPTPFETGLRATMAAYSIPSTRGSHSEISGT